MTPEIPDYSALALQHFRAPHNYGCFPPGTAQVLAGSAGSERLGRQIRFELRVEDGRVAECRYRVYGCPATVALCSLLSERLRGMTVVQARNYKAITLVHELMLPADKHGAALVAEDAVRMALEGYNMSMPRPA